MCKTKSKLREKYIQLRKNIKNKKIKSDEIFNKIICLEEYKLAKVIAIYKNLENEVSTQKLIDYSIKNNKIVVLPKVIDNDLKFYKIHSSDDKLEKSKFGILEPIKNIHTFIKPHQIDLVIVPGICFDIYNNRLGFGKGYYDRFLKNNLSKKIAICFEEQIIKDMQLPVTNDDIKMDKIVTDKKIYMI